MSDRLTGRELPQRLTTIPGPASIALADRLARVESRNITCVTGTAPPIFWTEARGASVRDADGNIFVDLTGGFGVAAAGHANRAVARAISRQAERLPHALGDVYPGDAKVELLEQLARIAPGDLEVSILASAGAEAVEAALKTAMINTGKPGILAFSGAYHGLTYGALAATSRNDFREHFAAQLYPGVAFVDFPNPFRPGDAADESALVDRTLMAIRAAFRAAAPRAPIGAVLIEPIQGRGGIVVPPAGFLRSLREACHEEGALLIIDEVYTGFGRTGRWFACEHDDVVPDVMTVGKAFSGSLPLSAAIGTRAVMDAWPPSFGEAIHTSTFLGNPIACAAGTAQIREIERRKLPARAARLGRRIMRRARGWMHNHEFVGDVRGRGLFIGVEIVRDGVGREPHPRLAIELAARALQMGVLLLTEGPNANVLAFTPPLVISDAQLDYALDVIESALAEARP